MRLLHTADWHVGRRIRGRSRAEEHLAVLGEIAGIAKEHQVDVVIVAGDLFDTGTPSPESERIVYRSLLELAAIAEHVIVVSGNHDNPKRLAAIRPLLNFCNIHVATEIRSPKDGGVLNLTLKSGEKLSVALLPFISQRGMIKASDLLESDATDHKVSYEVHMQRIIARLTESLEADAVRLAIGHLTVRGCNAAGSERLSQIIDEYRIDATAFPEDYHYVALGHLHAPQQLDYQPPIRYAGSPMQMDFGEKEDKSVTIIEAMADVPVKTQEIALKTYRRLRTIRETLQGLVNLDELHPEDYLRLFVKAEPHAGMADALRQKFPNAVQISIENPNTHEARPDDDPDRLARPPFELLQEYLKTKRIGGIEQLVTDFKALKEELDEATNA